MIDYVYLRNFKCFRDETIRFGGLTILCGLNSSGKSSVIRAVLALRQRSQAPRDRSWRGSLVNLGSFRDLLHFHASDDMVRLEASFFEGTGRAEDRYSMRMMLPWHVSKETSSIFLPIGLVRGLACHT